MASRVSLGFLAVALCALIAFLVQRRREAPAPRPAPAAISAPAATVAAPSARAARARTVAADPITSREETLLRGRLLEAYERARASGGAFAWLKSKIDAQPASEAERRERVTAFSLLAAAALEDPSKRGEVVTLLRSHLTTDADPDARLSCAAAMGGAALHLHDDGKRSWFWVGGLMDPSQESPDRRTLGVPLRDDLRAAWARETVPLNRMTLIQLLAEQPEPAEAEFYRSVLLDRDEASREYAVDALGSLPSSPETVAVLQRVLEGDADPKPRRRALAALVSLGAVDGLVTARLLAAAPSDPEGWELLGKAWSATKPPPIGAYLQSGLESPDPRVRGGVLASMAASGDKSFVPFIDAARARESDASLQQVYALALEKLNGNR